MADTPVPASNDRAERRRAAAESTIALIDSLANARGDIGIAFPRQVAKYLPQWRGDDQSPPFHVPNRGIAVANGASIDRVVAAKEKATGTEINELRWGRDSVIKRNAEGNFPTSRFNIFAAEKEPLLAKAAYQTIYDGRTESGRARQFLVANGELLHNKVRQPAQDGQGVVMVDKKGLGALSAVKDTQMFGAYVKGEALKAQVRENPSIAPYLGTALKEANERYNQTREQTRAKSGGMER